MRGLAVLTLALAAYLAPAAAGGDFSCPGCNVVLISVDALRADAVGAYGSGKGLTPNVDALASRGTLFSRAYANAPNTFPSHMSILSGRYPWRHGLGTVMRGERLAAEAATLPETLASFGYRTYWGAVLDSPHLDLAAGFGRGFTDLRPPSPETRYREPYGWGHVRGWLEANGRAPFFMFLHTGVAHGPYTPRPETLRRLSPGFPAGRARSFEELYAEYLSSRRDRPRENYWWERHGTQKEFFSGFDLSSPREIGLLKALYEACVADADYQVGRLLEDLRALGLDRNTLVVLTADHGEEFLEHGATLHNALYEETLRVPLVFSVPGRPGPGARSSQLAQSADIAPTVLDALGFGALSGADGFSLTPFAGPGAPSLPYRAVLSGGWGEMYSARDGRFSYLVSGKCPRGGASWGPQCFSEEIYDTAADPGEKKNLARELPEAAAGLAAQLRASLRAAGDLRRGDWPAWVTGRQRRELSDTGYWTPE